MYFILFSSFCNFIYMCVCVCVFFYSFYCLHSHLLHSWINYNLQTKGEKKKISLAFLGRLLSWIKLPRDYQIVT